MSANKPAASQEINRDLLVLTDLYAFMQCISQRYFCICDKALCVVGNELVLVSVQQGVYLRAFGELMKESPCCPTAKKKQESGKAGTRWATRGPASSGGLHENAHYTTRGKVAFPWLERPGPPCLREHPSAQTSLVSLQPLCRRSPTWVTWGHGYTWGNRLVPRVFSVTLLYKGKAPLRPSSL